MRDKIFRGIPTRDTYDRFLGGYSIPILLILIFIVSLFRVL